MENFGFDLSSGKKTVYLSCKLCGWNRIELPRSTTNHYCIDITWFHWQGAQLRPKNMIQYDTALFHTGDHHFHGTSNDHYQLFVADQDKTALTTDL